MIENYFKVKSMSVPNFKNKPGQKKGVFPNANTMLPASALKNPAKYLQSIF